MKVLFLTNIPSPYRVDFFNELGKYCDLTVLYELKIAADRNKRWLSDEAINYNEVYLNGIAVNRDSAICFNVIKWLKDRSYDIIIIGVYSSPTSMIAIEYLSKNRIPFIINCDGGFVKNDNKLKCGIKKHFISKASAWLSTASKSDEYLVHYGANKNDIYRYPFTSIKEKEVSNKMLLSEEKIKIRKKLSIKEDKVIITVGQFIHRKGFDILLNACSLIDKNVGTYFIGGNPNKEYIELQEELGLSNVHFIEFMEKDKLADYYMAADIFVLPTREDIWGLVINEAMAYGLPVITTDKCIAGLELIKDNENGYVVKSEDADELAKRIMKVITNEELINNFSNNNLEKIKEYTIEKMALRHFDILKDFKDNYIKLIKG